MTCVERTLILFGCALFILGVNAEFQPPTTIAAFNVQIFGTSKASEDDTMNVLIKVLQRYDIILVQEIRDSKETAIYKLLWKIQSDEKEYDMVISERLGSSNTKEQYAFIFRKDKGIRVTDTYQYPEPNTNADERTFERPPFCVRFKIPNAAVQDIAMIGIHTDPDKADEEIDALVDVHNDIKSRWKIDNILLLGDFNADCSYVSKSRLKTLKLKALVYHWLIPDDTDTTVSSTDCAYDRLVVSGETLLKNVVPGSAKVFYFDQEYGLTNDQAKDVSDHYPIEMAVKGKTGASVVNSDCTSGGSRVRSFFSGLLGLLVQRFLIAFLDE